MSKAESMNEHKSGNDQAVLKRALELARDTRFISVEEGARHNAANVLNKFLGATNAVIVADENTWAAAGKDVEASFTRRGRTAPKHFIFGPHIYADDDCVQELVAALRSLDGVPVAVGSGTINDLTKLASHLTNRPYMVVGTAASMDGYSAFGASITKAGSKNTVDCPGPMAVLADLEVIAKAPKVMNAWGYGDLLAKVVAGADWMLADAAGAEAIIPTAWELVQSPLRSWIGSPDAIAASEIGALRHLVCGLLMSGLAMQATLSSRPASGAEHQFSHLWDMQHHTFNGVAPSHGFKVGIGVLASLALQEYLLNLNLKHFDIDSAVCGWPSLDKLEGRIRTLFETEALQRRAIDETRGKYVSKDELRSQLKRVQERWGELQTKVRGQIYPFDEMRSMLRRAGCPYDPAQIGISRERLRLSYQQCCFLRNRFTVLDLVYRLGVFDAAMDHLFGPDGRWASSGEVPA
jgi:glycerol-1-phosphate dehydrogenase [NAD(P)+]